MFLSMTCQVGLGLFLADTLIDMLLRRQVAILKMIQVSDICAAGTGLFILRIIETLIFIFACISYDITLAVLGEAGWVDIIAEMITRVFQSMGCCIDKLPFHRISNIQKYACKEQSTLDG